MNNKKFISQLPTYFQTEINKKFYESTIDQLYNKKDSRIVSNYVGRKNGKIYNPGLDQYLESNILSRDAYTLEPCTYSIDYESLTRTDVCFYDDLVNYIKSNGGNTANHDRLFSCNKYSYSPPIDVDKFINYQSYYWVDDVLDAVALYDIDDNEIENNIIGNSEYSALDFSFTSGLRVIFPDSLKYNQRFYVEGVGREISLVPDLYSVTSMDDYTYKEWDVDEQWDKDNQWDIKLRTGKLNYITIERGCRDGNAWSRSNRWMHVDTLKLLLSLTNRPWPKYASRALRPIIEFPKDIELYKHGKQFIGTVDHIVTFPLSLANTMTLDEFIEEIGNSIQTGNTFLFIEGNTPRIYTSVIDEVTDSLTFEPSIFRQYDINGQTLNSQYFPINGDLTVCRYGPFATKTYEYNDGIWFEPTINKKSKINQPPLFALYDTRLNKLENYTSSNFAGSEIFSYKINNESNSELDSVLLMPIIYTGLGQVADIIFENDILTTTYQYINNNLLSDITGYYLYNIGGIYKSSWHYSEELTKQHIIHEYVYGRNITSNTLPIGVDIDKIESITVEINGIQNENFTLDIINYVNSIIISDTLNTNDFIKIRLYSKQALNASTNGFYEIPAALESNGFNDEVGDYTLNQLTTHFDDIIISQDNIEYTNLGQNNNYRDTKKDLSLGKKIIQTNGSLSYIMQNSVGDLDVLAAIEYSKDEYSKFKNKFIKLAQKYTNTLPNIDTNFTIDTILTEILNEINLPREENAEFSNTNMIAFGDSYQEEIITLNQEQTTNFNYITDQTHLYLWANNSNIETDILSNSLNINEPTLLTYNKDYIIENNNGLCKIIILSSALYGEECTIRYYDDIKSSYIPSTPSKLGLYQSVVPNISIDYSYTTPTWVITGHDNSKRVCYSNIDLNGTIVLADPVDFLILDLEKRIYNSINDKFKHEDYIPPITLSDILPTTSYITDYTEYEIKQILFSQFNMWATKTKSNYMINNTFDENNWKSFNYTSSLLPGSWRNIYTQLFRCDDFNFKPWKMLEFSSKPSWWDTEYGLAVNNLYTNSFTTMWNDIKNGIIRNGSRQGTYDKYKYPNLSIIPVDSFGNIIDIETYFNIPTGSYFYNNQWKYGDLSPVEYAWTNTSDYVFSVIRLLMLTKPALTSSQFWDTNNNNTVEYNNFNWISTKNVLEYNTSTGKRDNHVSSVTTENTDSGVTYFPGYQSWVADYLLRRRKNINTDYGHKMRNLSISLGTKLGGYTNNSTFRAFLESITSTNSSGLRIPENNIDVLLHKGKPVAQYVFSGVIVRLTQDNKYAVYGYDNSSYSFKYYDIDSTQSPQIIKEGGVPSSYVNFEYDKFYSLNQIVRFNTLFYISNVAHQAITFDENNWTLLPSLPTSGGVTVNLYKSNKLIINEISYGHIFNTIQQVFNFLNGYGDYLEDNGWIFNDVDSNNGYIINWLSTARQFLNWSVSTYVVDTLTFLNPVSNQIKLKVSRGYPENVERIVNGFYSILDKTGLAIDPKNTIITRNDQNITVNSLTNEGLYMLRLLTAETEHIVLFDNLTSFDDIVYDPILNIRQTRIKISATISNNWFGKFEAPGYLIQGNELIPNYENLVSSISHYYDMDTLIDNQDIELAAKSLVGYQDRQYLNGLGIDDELQFAFYQGFIKEKGTQNSIDKILRTDLIDSANSTNISEEWAIKLGEYGNIDYSQIDILIDPTYTISKNQVISIDKNNTNKLKIHKILVVSNDTLYDFVPVIKVKPDPTDENVVNIITAVLRVELENRKIKNVIIENPGSGYTKTPTITIDNSTDIVYPVMDKDINIDTDYDFQYIVNENDISRTLSIKPYNQSLQKIELTDRSSIELPTAGFVHLNDVDFFVYELSDLINYTYDLREKSVYIGNLYTKDWNVFTVNIATTDDIIFIQRDEFIEVSNFTYNPRLNGAISNNSGIVFILVDNILLPFIFKYDEEVDYIRLFNNANDPVYYNDVYNNEKYVLKTLRYNINNTPSMFNRYWIDNINIAVAEITSINSSGAVLSIDVYNPGYYTQIPSYKVMSNGSNLNLKIALNENGGVTVNIISAGTNYEIGDRIIFSNTISSWGVIDNKKIVNRKEPALIKTNTFAEAYLYSYSSNNTLARLPIFDPVKGYLPGPVEQNIDFKSFYDPAKYTNDDIFGESEIGKVWLDLSTCKFLWYEQPRGFYETEQDIIMYNKQYWGKVFPGCPIDVYEWTESKYTPENYILANLDGIPYKNDTYVTKTIYNSNLLDFENRYYFWVKSKNRKPNKKNRTLSTSEISNLIRNVQTSGYQCYSPIFSATYDTYALFNCDNTLSNDKCVLSIKYGNNYNYHTEWKLLSLDTKEFPEILWDKLVDSLVGYTSPISTNIANSIKTTDGYVVPVPNIMLPKYDQLGLNIRPVQLMFTDVNEARREFTLYVNNLLNEILIDTVYNNKFLYRVNWYKSGYNLYNTKPLKTINNIVEISDLNLVDGDIVRILNSRQYLRFSNNVYEVIRVDNGTYQIDSNFYKININNYHKDTRDLFTIIKDTFDINAIFFLMIEYAFSESEIINWCFKTSYINIKQNNKLLTQKPFFTPSSDDNLIDYINETKPYHTKIRNFTSSLSPELEIASYVAEDSGLYNITVYYDDVCDNKGWDTKGWDENRWDPEKISCKRGVILSGNEFSNGWDINSWDKYAWDKYEEYDIISGGLWDSNIVHDTVYTAGIFNSPHHNGAPRDLYINGSLDDVLINIRVMNIPQDIDTSIYEISSALIGTQVITPSGTYTITETFNVENITYTRENYVQN